MSIGVSVDPKQCALSGYCERIAPQVFEIRDDVDVAQVKQPEVSGAEDEELVEEAEASCPTRAIVLERR